jgi:hypothetical protein
LPFSFGAQWLYQLHHFRLPIFTMFLTFSLVLGHTLFKPLGLVSLAKCFTKRATAPGQFGIGDFAIFLSASVA